MKALLSIMTLYNYDNSIFDNFKLPSGIVKEDVTNNLLMELSELEVIYADPNMMKLAIGFWSSKEVSVWEKLLATTKFEYNPIWNLDGKTEITDIETRNLTGSNNETRNLTGSDNETRNLTGSDNETRDLTGTAIKHSETTETTTNNGTDTSKEYVSGFNETTSTLAKQTEQLMGSGNTVGGSIDGTDTTTDKGTVNKELTDAGTVNKELTDAGTVNKELTDSGTVNKELTDSGTVNKELTDSGTVEKKNVTIRQGNIGVSTTQSMIEEERKTVKFNIINYIIDSFKGRFCLLIY